ncbi:MAG TPA: phosphoglucomutase/phosphomannomutase family protein, partial [Dehalococcoidia bacterium]|nr:phosphoglucomutase/phosphomannomutase family protein [Dehalococcoidia bacterium]
MEASIPIKFGTDGWRAIIAEDYTFTNVRACMEATCRFLEGEGLAGRGLVIGWDTRFGSRAFAEACAEVAAAHGITVHLTEGPAATPIVSFALLRKRAGGAVVITSSHNPAMWNGFKYKPEYAGSASPEVIAGIESHLPAIFAGGEPPRRPLADAEAEGLVRRFDPAPAYEQHVAQLVDLDGIRSASLRVAVDSMYGAGAGWFNRLLAGGGTKVRELHGEVNPAFPGIAAPEPIAKNLALLLEGIASDGADVGLATDGDADRLGIVDERGAFVNQLQVFALLTYYLLEVRGARGPIVKSVTTTQMVNRLGELYGVPVHETPVGFKYLGPKMMETDALIGGEESGGYGFRGHIPERDGILAGLYFLDFIARTGRRPSELLADLYAKVGPHFYDRIDVHLDPERRKAIEDRVIAAKPDELAGVRVVSRDTTDGYRFLLEGGGWLLIRFSGTEPLMRVYTEVRDEALVPKLLEAGR